jgi:hypothetical protein
MEVFKQYKTQLKRSIEGNEKETIETNSCI